MEKRNVEISLEQAIAWYNSDNKALVELALSAYKPHELNNIENIIKYSCSNSNSSRIQITVPEEYVKKMKANAKLSILANHFNKGWKRTCENKGYFINLSRDILLGTPTEYKVEIKEHSTVIQAGVIYFQSPEAVAKAVLSLSKDEVRSLFL